MSDGSIPHAGLISFEYASDQERANVMRTYQRMLDDCSVRAFVQRHIRLMPIRMMIVDGEPECEPFVMPRRMQKQLDTAAAYYLERAMESHGFRHEPAKRP